MARCEPPRSPGDACRSPDLYLAATGHGQLSIVAVVASLYPAFTVLLARAVRSERWSRTQMTGLLVAAASVVLVSVG